MRHSHVLVAACAVAVGVGIQPAFGVTDDSALPAGTVLAVSGHGTGDGRGMSQSGAKAAAASGLSYRQILDFYFPGTTWASSSGTVRVLISADTTSAVEVAARPGLVARRVGSRQTWPLNNPNATEWRLAPRGSSRTTLAYNNGGRWTPVASVDGEIEFDAGDRPMRLYLPGGGSAQYRGTLRSVSAAAGSSARDTVNVVSLENYVRGVIAEQMPASSPVAAMQSQAVVTRTLAAKQTQHQRRRTYDLCDGDSAGCQPYDGVSAETRASDNATDSTSGRILTFGGAPATTPTTISNGGWVRAGAAHYLMAKPDPYDTSDTWDAAVPVSTLEHSWPNAGPITAVTATSEDTSPWVSTVTIHGQIRDYTVKVDSFRSRLGLRSEYFTLEPEQPVPTTDSDPDPPAQPRAFYQEAVVPSELAWSGIGVSGDFTFTRAIDDNDPNIDHFVVAVDGPGPDSPAESVTSTWRFTPSTYGMWNIHAYAVDDLGRTSAPTNITINVPVAYPS